MIVFASFPNIILIFLTFHRPGSIINEIKLNFESNSVPNNTQIAAVLIDASSTVNGFDIEGDSITVNGIGKCDIAFLHTGFRITELAPYAFQGQFQLFF